ncbi:MAG: hypothetical protein WEB90_04185 [Gemmatimonadota bacterium]
MTMRVTKKAPGRRVALVAGVWVVAGSLWAAGAVEGQGLTYNHGQSVAPAYEGWERNPDGSFNLVFGYMNRNWEEEVSAPIGADNAFSPGPADRGQPTHFLPRRNRFVFKVRVPADFGEQELTWTVRANGEERVAIGTLRQDYFVDNVVVMSETGALGAGSSNPELRAQTPPSIALETPREITAQVGRPVRLVAHVTDDGLPERDSGRLPLNDEGLIDYRRATAMVPSRITVDKVNGLYLSWFIYRAPDGVDGQAAASFSPGQVHPWEDTRPYSNSPWAPFWIPPELPADGRWITEVTFHRPGTYVLRGRADDGGLFADEEVTIHVRGPVS